MKAIGSCFYGAFTGDGFPLVGLSQTTIQSSLKSARKHRRDLLQHPGFVRRQRRVPHHRAKKKQDVTSELTNGNGNRVGDQRTDHDHSDHGDNEYGVRDFLEAMHSAQSARP